MIVIECAPKLGHVLFDPLSYEAEQFERVKTLLKELIPPTTTTEVETTVSTSTKTTTSRVEVTSTTETVTLSDERYTTNVPNKLSDVFKMIENAWGNFRSQANPVKYLRTDGDPPESDCKEPCAEYEYNGKICKVVSNRLLCGYNKNKGELKNEEFVDMGNGCRVHNDRIECGYETGPFKNPRRPPARDEISNEDETHNAESKVPKLRSDNTITTSRIVASNCNGCLTKSSEPNETPDIANDTLATTDHVSRAQVTTDSWLELEATESSPELVVTTDSSSGLVVTTDSLPELVTTESSPKFTVTTTQLPNYSTSELVTTATRNITVSLPESVTKTPLLKTTKGLEKTTISVSAHMTTKEKSLPSRKITRILRSIAETPEKPTTNGKKKPTRWCVEKGDRIVCYYAKNY